MFEGMEIGLHDKNGTPIKCGDRVKEYWIDEDDEAKVVIEKVVYVPEVAAFGLEEEYIRNGEVQSDIYFLTEYDFKADVFEVIKEGE